MLGLRRIGLTRGGMALGMPPSKTTCRRHFRGLVEAPLLPCLTFPPLLTPLPALSPHLAPPRCEHEKCREAMLDDIASRPAFPLANQCA